MKTQAVKILQGCIICNWEKIEIWKDFISKDINLLLATDSDDKDCEDEFAIVNDLMDNEGEDLNFHQNIYSV